MRTYPSLEGNPVSVTSVIDAVLRKEKLERWREYEIGRLARLHPEDNIGGLLGKWGENFALRGQRVHKRIEKALLEVDGEPDTRGCSSVERLMLENWRTWWGGELYDVIEVERVVHHPGKGYAGTLDAIFDRDGYRHVVDWKTARKLPHTVYPEHLMQVSAYATASSMPPVASAAVVYISPLDVEAYEIDTEGIKKWARAFTHLLEVARILHPEWWPS